MYQSRGNCRPRSSSRNNSNAWNPSSSANSKSNSATRGQGKNKGHLVKMELCQSVFSREKCPYGDSCNFAHNKNELRLKSYSERNKDEAKFRTLPCFDFVSTGHCPFGVRCAGLHDNRVAATLEDFTCVECKEFPIDKLSTTVNVDYQYSTKQSELHHGPFGYETDQMLASFDDFSNSVCNKVQAGGSLYSDAQRLQVAIAFDTSRSDAIKSCFEYKATHIITDPKTSTRYTCMQVQSKVFHMKNGRATEVHLPNMPGISTPPGLVTVRELAFCQDSRLSKDSAESAPGLFFNIPDCDIKKATIKEIKELKRSATSWDMFSSYCLRMSLEPPFYIYYIRRGGHCGIDELMSNILTFKLMHYLGRTVPTQMIALQSRFLATKRALNADKWCSTRGTENRKPHHDVPSTSTLYVADEKDKKHLWESFTKNPWQDHPWGDNAMSRGLSTMAHLSEGKLLAKDDALLDISYDANIFDETKETSMFSQWNMVCNYYNEKKNANFTKKHKRLQNH